MHFKIDQCHWIKYFLDFTCVTCMSLNATCVEYKCVKNIPIWTNDKYNVTNNTDMHLSNVTVSTTVYIESKGWNYYNVFANVCTPSMYFNIEKTLWQPRRSGGRNYVVMHWLSRQEKKKVPQR